MGRVCCMEYFRNFGRNLFLSIVLAVMGLIIVSVVSLYRYEYGKAAPFLRLSEKADYYVIEQGGSDISNVPGVSKWLCMKKASLKLGDVDLIVYLYDSWLYRYWAPRMREGKWIAEPHGTKIGVVLGGMTKSYSVGDCLQLNNGMVCEVIGILQENTEIFWKESNGADMYIQNSYIGYFMAPQIVGKSGIYAIMSLEDAEKAGIQGNSCGNFGIAFFEQKLTKAEREKKCEELAEIVDGAGVRYENFLKESKKQLQKKAGGLLPFALVALTLTLLVIGYTNYFTIKEGMGVYRIYHLIGASKKKCIIIAYANAVGVVVISLVFYYIGQQLLQKFAQKNDYVISLQGSGGYVLEMYILFLILPGIMLLGMLAGRTPMEIVRGEKR